MCLCAFVSDKLGQSFIELLIFKTRYRCDWNFNFIKHPFSGIFSRNTYSSLLKQNSNKMVRFIHNSKDKKGSTITKNPKFQYRYNLFSPEAFSRSNSRCSHAMKQPLKHNSLSNVLLLHGCIHKTNLLYSAVNIFLHLSIIIEMVNNNYQKCYRKICR